MRSCLHCDCLPGSIGGVDIDTIFAYQTKKVVKIKDRTLGILNYLMMFAIFMFICIFQMAYQGKHFKITEPEGIYRAQWQQPTKGCNPNNVDCADDFKSVTRLPYCSQYNSPKGKLAVTKPCNYYDAKELPIALPQGVLVPTYIETFDQARECDVNTDDCDRAWVFTDGHGKPQHGKGRAKATAAFFVADAEDFSVLIDHSFKTKTGGAACDGHESCNDYDMQGYWFMPGDTDDTAKPIACRHDKCTEVAAENSGYGKETSLVSLPHGPPSGPDHHTSRGEIALRGDIAKHSRLRVRARARAPLATGDMEEEEEETVKEATAVREPFALEDGDIFSLDTLFAMANVSLDEKVFRMEEGETIRLRGTVLVMEIFYTNKRHWHFLYHDNPWYSVKVTPRKVEDFKEYFVYPDSKDNSRKLVKPFGTYIIIQQHGEIAVWDTAQVCAWLGGAVGLIMIASTIIDILATSVMPRYATYSALKYQESEDRDEWSKPNEHSKEAKHG